MHDDIATIVTTAIRAYASGKVEEMLASVTEDVEYALYLEETEVPFAGTTIGKDILQARIQQMHHAFDYILFRLFPGRIIDATMHNQVEFMYRHRATGQLLDGRFRFLLTVDGGLITHIAEYHDAERVKAFMRLVGGESPAAEAALEPMATRQPFGDHLARLRTLADPAPASSFGTPGLGAGLGLHGEYGPAPRPFVDLVNRKDEEFATAAAAVMARDKAT